MKAPRGGGKSRMLGTAGFDLWYLKGRKVVAMGGSLAQANIVYGYFQSDCALHPSVADYIAGGDKGINIQKTTSIQGADFACVPASPKQVRGKHPDVLISDETCETSDELIDSATPMVNDSEHPLIVMASTFHKVFGRFAETWDNAEQMGYHRISWDIFDVCKEFAPDFWENGILQDGKRVASIQGIEKLKKHAAGRTGDTDGWIRVENIVQAWREKPSESWFEVEYLGSRPSTAGLVLNPEDVDAAFYDDEKEKRFGWIPGATSVIGIDWGYSTMTSVSELMGYRDQTVSLIDQKNYHQDPSAEIIADVVAIVKAHGTRLIYADSAGKFENVALQAALNEARLGCRVIEVVFSKEKEGMVGNLRAHFERRKFKAPRRFKDAFYQLKNYRFQEGSDKPVKKDDHVPDSIMCGLQHYKLNVKSRPLKVQTTPDGRNAQGGSEKPLTSGIMRERF